MRAILVSVDYGDLLSITLRYNRDHFDAVYVVTTPADKETQRVAAINDAIPILTDCFFDDGAIFNKWKGLEYGLDVMGREGWICVMDADVLWPKSIQSVRRDLKIGKLYSPLRRMLLDFPRPFTRPPGEESWSALPIHPNVNEWAGYTQIFHASDPVLGPPPWHETNWKHAGGADSFFQRKWRDEDKIRLPFHVLHLGSAGENWCGRVSKRLDGSEPDKARERLAELQKVFAERRRTKGFEGEKIIRR